CAKHSKRSYFSRLQSKWNGWPRRPKRWSGRRSMLARHDAIEPRSRRARVDSEVITTYLSWILVRYWLALRAAGQDAEAAKVRPRADAMWAKYGAGHLSG